MDCNGKATQVEEASEKVDHRLKVENVHSTEASPADVESILLEDPPNLYHGLTEATQSTLDKVPPIVSTTSAIKEHRAEDFNINCNNVKGDKNKDIKSETQVNIGGGSEARVEQLMNPSSVQQTAETFDQIKIDSEKMGSKCHSLEERPESAEKIITNVVSERLIVDEIPSYSDGTKTTDAIVTHCTAALIGQSSVIDHINMVAEKQMTRRLSAEIEKKEEHLKGTAEGGSAAGLADQMLDSLGPEVKGQLKEISEKNIETSKASAKIDQQVKEDVEKDVGASRSDYQIEEKLKMDLDKSIDNQRVERSKILVEEIEDGTRTDRKVEFYLENDHQAVATLKKEAENESVDHQGTDSSKISVETIEAGAKTDPKVKFYIGQDDLVVDKLDKKAENKKTDLNISHQASDKDVKQTEVKDIKVDQKVGRIDEKIDHHVGTKIDDVEDKEITAKLDHQMASDLGNVEKKSNIKIDEQLPGKLEMVIDKDLKLEVKQEIDLGCGTSAMNVEGISGKQPDLQLSAKEDQSEPCKLENPTEYVKLGLTDGNIEVQETTLHDVKKYSKDFDAEAARKMSTTEHESNIVKETFEKDLHTEKVETVKQIAKASESDQFKNETGQSDKKLIVEDVLKGSSPTAITEDRKEDKKVTADKPKEKPLKTENGMEMETKNGFHVEVLDSMPNKHELSDVDAVIMTSQIDDEKSTMFVETETNFKPTIEESIKPSSEIPGKLIADGNFMNGRLESKFAPMPTAKKESIDNIKADEISPGSKIEAETNKPSNSEEQDQEKKNKATETKNKTEEKQQKKDILHEPAGNNEQESVSEIFEQKEVENNVISVCPVTDEMAVNNKLVLTEDDDEGRKLEDENETKLVEMQSLNKTSMDYVEIQEKQIKKTVVEETISEEKVIKAKDTEEGIKKQDIKDAEILDEKNKKSYQREAKKDAKKEAKTKDENAKSKKQDGDHDSGVDESTQRKKTPPAAKGTAVAPSSAKKVVSPTAAVASPAKTQKTPTTNTTTSKSSTPTPSLQGKKLPMNKVVVGTSPSPNLKVVRSKIGSFDNVKHKAGGGQVKVETKKIDLANVKSRIGSTGNIEHKPTGGEKKILSRKLEWKAQSKIGSMENATHKPGGGNKKIEVQKLEFKDKAKPKVGSKDNLQHKPGGGDLKIEEHKLSFKDSAQSKVGSMDYVKHQPGGGNIQIFDEKFYHKQRDSSKKSSLTNSDDHEHLSENRTPSPLAVSPQPQQGASPLPPLNKEVSQTNGDSALHTGAH